MELVFGCVRGPGDWVRCVGEQMDSVPFAGEGGSLMSSSAFSLSGLSCSAVGLFPQMYVSFLLWWLLWGLWLNVGRSFSLSN